MLNFNFYVVLAGIALLLGITGRVQLITSNPLWYDEAHSIRAAAEPLQNILTGTSDPVHPPGYYLLIKLLSIFSQQLILLRFSTLIFFCINCFLIYIFTKINLNRKAALISLMFYSLSGYFVVFDWQVRMYTPVVTCILLSQILYNKINSNRHTKLHIIGFIFINLIGLYLDYAFFWYFVPFSVWIGYQKYIKRSISTQIFLYSTISSIGFLLIYPQIFHHFPQGLSGIMWIEPYINPLFSIPYLFGLMHQNWSIAITCLLMILIASYISIRHQIRAVTTLLYISLVSVIFSVIFSLIKTPIFHVRSLQIVSLTILITISYALSLIAIKSKKLFFVIFIIQCGIFFNSIWTIENKPGNSLVYFLPWKEVIEGNNLGNYPLIKFWERPTSSSPLFVWSLKYSLSGKEFVSTKPIRYQQLSSQPINLTQCDLVYADDVEIYGCRQ